ncbi:hypothetical protein SBD_0203 [Streptomyces bottropensis ATCC 25435]|uniref:Uncharacterized protein n=1 Tax=Streptomyces bottropensis ATCC 25435 TaxID=1054862 RepID=M3EM51_9ACTN|nr:hypothetical protein SBD_0203 [Streptomyces bottropensis ATCC 25435]
MPRYGDRPPPRHGRPRSVDRLPKLGPAPDGSLGEARQVHLTGVLGGDRGVDLADERAGCCRRSGRTST